MDDKLVETGEFRVDEKAAKALGFTPKNSPSIEVQPLDLSKTYNDYYDPANRRWKWNGPVTVATLINNNPVEIGPTTQVSEAEYEYHDYLGFWSYEGPV